jgi:hypothetical protein
MNHYFELPRPYSIANAPDSNLQGLAWLQVHFAAVPEKRENDTVDGGRTAGWLRHSGFESLPRPGMTAENLKF